MHRTIRWIIGMLPLTITMAATALTYQNAEAVMLQHVTDDTLASVIDYVCPASQFMLACCYIVSAIAVLLVAFGQRFDD